MARGRFLSRAIAHNEQLPTVSEGAALLFTLCIPHLDREGRMSGHPSLVKAVAVPLLSGFTEQRIARCLGELVGAGLVVWYQVGTKLCLFFPGFLEHNRGIKKDREAPSTIPDPNDNNANRITSLPTYSGPTPDNSGEGPPEVEVQGEVQVQDSSSSSVLRTEATPRTDLSHLMGTLRVTGYAPDGQPPAPDDPARDVTVFKALLKGGRSVDDLADALRGVRAVADRQLPLPEGDQPWLAPFAKFTARFVYHTKWGGRPLADVARDVWRKGRPVGERGGVADVGSILRRQSA